MFKVTFITSDGDTESDTPTSYYEALLLALFVKAVQELGGKYSVSKSEAIEFSRRTQEISIQEVAGKTLQVEIHPREHAPIDPVYRTWLTQ
jgi:hypothetical protein